MLKNKIFIPLLIALFIISFISANARYNVNSSVPLVTTCENCTNANVTQITYPNSTIAFVNIPMTKVNQTNFVYNFNNTLQVGTYSYISCGDLDGFVTCRDTEPRTFEIGDTGFFKIDFTSTAGIVVLIVLFLLAIFLYFLGTDSYKNFSSLILIIIGFLLMFNGVSVIISFIFLVIGVVILFERRTS